MVTKSIKTHSCSEKCDLGEGWPVLLSHKQYVSAKLLSRRTHSFRILHYLWPFINDKYKITWVKINFQGLSIRSICYGYLLIIFKVHDVLLAYVFNTYILSPHHSRLDTVQIEATNTKIPGPHNNSKSYLTFCYSVWLAHRDLLNINLSCPPGRMRIYRFQSKSLGYLLLQSYC